MAYASGLTTRIGKVADGNTISDYDKEEIKRKFSITTSVVPIIWEGCKINVLDAPGYFDFVGEPPRERRFRRLFGLVGTGEPRGTELRNWGLMPEETSSFSPVHWRIS